MKHFRNGLLAALAITAGALAMCGAIYLLRNYEWTRWAFGFVLIALFFSFISATNKHK